ncbi:MAG TPA: diacylglyceryl transferase [Flavobacteriales bacterium]|jgi:hypothetical protein|nr:diacylglyceryl transferase [Flavobacteriales bacterium]
MSDHHPTPTGNGWMDRLAQRWGVSPSRVLVILLVFACTGTTVLLIKRPILTWVTGGAEPSLWVSVVYYILILPFYNLILLIYGALFGQFSFFWNFEKRFLRRITGRS